jgi:putative toxin-antitoxin system antitoxin component (TIGR02293 family)
MSKAESISSYRRDGESLANTRERLRSVVSNADDIEFAARLRKVLDGDIILAKAVEVFGSRGAARTWLSKPAIGLGNYSAAELLESTEGRQRVIAYLTRLEHGVFS